MSSSSVLERLQLVSLDPAEHRDDFSADVRKGLTSFPKRLSCRFLYDSTGSLLFEKICQLPEYYVTRKEREILAEHADELSGMFPEWISLVELGSGSASKTRVLIDAFLRRHHTLRYVPIDISSSILEESSLSLLEDYSRLKVVALAAEYEQGVRRMKTLNDRGKLILWLGSNVGNLGRGDACRFLTRVQSTLRRNDRILVGIDLRKDRQILERAYDDVEGVTARFNLNLLARINRELGGRFDLSAFQHRAVYNGLLGRVEISLVSLRDQIVCVDGLDLDVVFRAGESIHTENSYKYSCEEIDLLASASGLAVEHRWFDRDRYFSVNLLRSGG